MCAEEAASLCLPLALLQAHFGVSGFIHSSGNRSGSVSMGWFLAVQSPALRSLQRDRLSGDYSNARSSCREMFWKQVFPVVLIRWSGSLSLLEVGVAPAPYVGRAHTSLNGYPMLVNGWCLLTPF